MRYLLVIKRMIRGLVTKYTMRSSIERVTIIMKRREMINMKRATMIMRMREMMTMTMKLGNRVIKTRLKMSHYLFFYMASKIMWLDTYGRIMSERC